MWMVKILPILYKTIRTVLQYSKGETKPPNETTLMVENKRVNVESKLPGSLCGQGQREQHKGGKVQPVLKETGCSQRGPESQDSLLGGEKEGSGRQHVDNDSLGASQGLWSVPGLFNGELDAPLLQGFGCMARYRE